MTKIVIVSEPHQIKVLKNRLAGATVVATSSSIKELLAVYGISATTPEMPRNMQENLIVWMKKLPKIFSDNGVNVLEKLSYNGLSYWWVMEKWLFRGDGHSDVFSDVLNAAAVVDRIIKDNKPEEIIFVWDGKLYSKVIKHIADTNNIKTRRVPFSMNKLFSLKKSFMDIVIKKFLASSFYLRKFLSKKPEPKPADVLFIRGIAWERRYDYETGKSIIVEPFTDGLKKRFD
ncbi:MAG: hypothetical protein ABIG30_01075, partial [Candidatus Aenigmatarchaeota archaeon]